MLALSKGQGKEGEKPLACFVVHSAVDYSPCPFVKHWQVLWTILSGRWILFPSLEVFKARLDGALSNVV